MKNYFRTTNKGNLALESNLIDHGLDSLDQIEIAMVIEEELGYVISAETLPVLQKVKHIVNYIKHVEQFKTELQRAPLSWSQIHHIFTFILYIITSILYIFTFILLFIKIIKRKMRLIKSILLFSWSRWDTQTMSN